MCDWLSTAIDKKVFVLHSPMQRTNTLNPKRILLDRKDCSKTYTTDAAFHIVNEASVRYLRERCLDRYPVEERSQYKVEAI